MLCASLAVAEVPAPIFASDFIPFDPVQAQLGQLLFYDKILSGNRNIACATCHHPDHGTSDGLSLGIGEGGEGLGPKRTAGSGPDRIKKRIPRNAPGLWNLGHRSINVMFHDGRLIPSELYENQFYSPAEEWLPKGFNSILAAQAVFPLVAQFEMAGNPRENEIAGAVHDRIDAAWPILTKRITGIPKYRDAIINSFDHIDSVEQISIVEIANALAAFMGREWQSFDSPFDAFLRGETSALSPLQRRGSELFYGIAGCSDCHAGPLLSDQKFHALALPAYGPGRTRRWDPMPRDVGRMGVTDRIEDAYKFRTPSLRNVALTAPYGHNGAYPNLEGIIRHHFDPKGSLARWDNATARLPDVPWLAEIDFVIQSDTREMARLARVVSPVSRQVSDQDIAALVAFMNSLTGASSQDHRLGIPQSVPSGLPFEELKALAPLAREQP